MRVAELWRYPVKSLAGERLERVEVTPLGLRGDRRVVVRGPGGGVVTARTRPRLLGLAARIGPGGDALIDGRPWTAPESLAAVRAAAGEEITLDRPGDAGVFDVLPLLVATDGAIARFGYDRRRLRPNIVIAGVEGLAERDWPGRRLLLGGVEIGVAQVRPRCVMTTFDPDTQEQDPRVLRRIATEFGGRLALDCFVVTPGPLAAGDPVELL